MKFAHELLALQADCPAEFSGRFINYKQLKKIIKQIRDVEAAGGPDSPAEAQFLHLLNVEVAAVNRCRSMPRLSNHPRQHFSFLRPNWLALHALLLAVALSELCALIVSMCACRTFETYAQDLVHAAALKRRRRKSCCLPRLRKRNLKVGMHLVTAVFCAVLIS
jgi:hypothetical protein